MGLIHLNLMARVAAAEYGAAISGFLTSWPLSTQELKFYRLLRLLAPSALPQKRTCSLSRTETAILNAEFGGRMLYR